MIHGSPVSLQSFPVLLGGCEGVVTVADEVKRIVLLQVYQHGGNGGNGVEIAYSVSGNASRSAFKIKVIKLDGSGLSAGEKAAYAVGHVVHKRYGVGQLERGVFPDLKP